MFVDTQNEQQQTQATMSCPTTSYRTDTVYAVFKRPSDPWTKISWPVDWNLHAIYFDEASARRCAIALKSSVKNSKWRPWYRPRELEFNTKIEQCTVTGNVTLFIQPPP